MKHHNNIPAVCRDTYVYPINGNLYKLACIYDNIDTELQPDMQHMINTYMHNIRLKAYGLRYNDKFCTAVKKLCRHNIDDAVLFTTCLIMTNRLMRKPQPQT